MRTLEQILTAEKKCRHESGIFGITACKEAIRNRIDFEKKYNNVELSLFTLLEQYVNRANKDFMFNTAMVLACWEMINENNE